MVLKKSLKGFNFSAAAGVITSSNKSIDPKTRPINYYTVRRFIMRIVLVFKKSLKGFNLNSPGCNPGNGGKYVFAVFRRSAVAGIITNNNKSIDPKTSLIKKPFQFTTSAAVVCFWQQRYTTP